MRTVQYVRKTKDVPILDVPEPDWNKIILDLRRQGYPMLQLQAKIGTTRETLDGIVAGRSKPSWHVGEYLRRLHNEIH